MSKKPLKVYYSTKLLNRLVPAPMFNGTGFGMLSEAAFGDLWTDEDRKQAIRSYYGLDEEVPPHSGDGGRRFESYDKDK
jgi:hypothetical protein